MRQRANGSVNNGAGRRVRPRPLEAVDAPRDLKILKFLRHYPAHGHRSGPQQKRTKEGHEPVHRAFAVIAAEVEQLETLDVAERSASQSARAARTAAARKALVGALTRAGHTARVLGNGRIRSKDSYGNERPAPKPGALAKVVGQDTASGPDQSPPSD